MFKQVSKISKAAFYIERVELFFDVCVALEEGGEGGRVEGGLVCV